MKNLEDRRQKTEVRSQESGVRSQESERGVTLIEMLVVVVIIGLFVAIVGPRLFSRAEEAKRTAAKTQLANFNQTLGLYKLDVGTFPTTEQGLLALRVKPDNVSQWNGPYLQQDVPLDPWGRQYVYQYPGEHGDEPDISSLGPDGTPSGDDIVSWKLQ
jgi:general secretion pathway protein G